MATTKKKGRKSAGKAVVAEAASAAPRKARKSKSKTAKAAPARRSGSAKRASSAPAAVRRAEVLRETSETRISVRLAIGEPGYRIETGVPFLDHMLEALSRHSGIGLAIEASGDTHIDDHHTVEDVGLAIGEALRRALGDKVGIYRFGHFETPLDEALVAVTIDLSGRPYLVYNVGLKPQRVGTFDVGLVEDFFQALMTTAGMNLHVNTRYGRNPHHIIEATFKAFAKALRMACAIDAATDGVPSTKGSLDG
jgi:imidazoleglycerol-phosphate dehydratase